MSEASRPIAVVRWGPYDALAHAIGNELKRAGYAPTYFHFTQPPPPDAAVVFSFAPYGRWMQIPHALAQLPAATRPQLIHWNTENPPDLRVPWWVMRATGAVRAGIDRWHDADDPRLKEQVQKQPWRWLDTHLTKYRYVGEVHYAAQKGMLDLYIESSEIYAALHSRHGLPTLVAPWGTVTEWCADLKSERDVDVLWFGQRRNKRRSRLLDQVRAELKARGVEMYVADGVEHPFLHGDERTKLLNRAKVTLNLLPTWYDHAFPYRFHVAAGNRSLVITEPMLKHCSLYHEGEHYVSAPIAQLADTITRYVRHDSERRAIVENAYELVTTRMTMGHSVRAIMARAEKRGRGA